jgi:hypothetical protein
MLRTAKQIFTIYYFIVIAVLLNSNDIFSQLSDTSKGDLSHAELFSNEIQHYDFSTGFSYLNKTCELNPFKKDINYAVLAGMGAAFLGTAISVHLYQQKAWWSNQRTSFHFQNDWNYALGIDKIGHAYGAMLIQHGISSGLEAANLSSQQCVWYGSIAALSFQTFIEIEDGFGPQWGFSPGDFYSNVVGSAYPVLQYYYPVLKNFMLKVSYWPHDLNKTNPVSGQKHIVADDYHGQKFWFSTRIKNILPRSVDSIWPEFLMLAIGMGVKNLDGNGGGQRDFYIALDLDAETIPLYGSFWQFVKNTLNFVHLPMPGVRVTSGGAFFVFCY